MEPEIEELLAQVQEQQRQIEAIQRSVTAMAVTGYAGNGDVVATVNGSGRFTEITIDPQVARRYDPETLGSLVLEAVNDALARLSQASQARFAPIIEAARQAAEG